MPVVSILILSAPFQMYLQILKKKKLIPQLESEITELMSNPLHYKVISKFMHTIQHPQPTTIFIIFVTILTCMYYLCVYYNSGESRGGGLGPPPLEMLKV